MDQISFFGDFLVKNNVIKESELVEALIEQQASQKSILEIIYEDKLLSSSEIIKVVQHSLTENTDFLSSLKALKYWNQISEKVMKLNHKNQKSIASILISNKVLELSVFGKILEDYLGSLNETSFAFISQNDAELKKENSHSEEVTGQLNLSESDAEALRDIFNESKVQYIKNLLLSYEMNKNVDAALGVILKELYAELYTVRGVCKMYQINQLEIPIDSLLEDMTAALDKKMIDKDLLKLKLNNFFETIFLNTK